MDPNTIPTPDLLALINRGTRGQPLTPDEARKLQTWAAANAANTDPAWITAIANAIGSAPGGQAAANGYDPATNQPPAPVWTPPPSTTAAPASDTGEDWVAAAAADPDTEPQPTMGDFDPAAMTWPSNGQPDDPGFPRQRKRDREGGSGRTPGDRLQQGNPLGPDSAFSGITDPGALSTIADNPDIAARYVARKRGNEHGAPIISESMRNALALSGMGLLGGGSAGMSSSGKRDLSSIPRSSAEQLGRAENWLGQMEQNGTFADPQAIYKKMFRRVRNTDPNLMSTGEGEAGDMENQINVTTGALLDAASASGMDEDNLGWLQARLGQAAQEYVMGVAEGSIDPMRVSYPNWLRSEKKAHRWLGR